MARTVFIAQGVERRRQMLLFIRRYMAKHGYAPSVAEIAEGVGLTSKTAVRGHLNILVEQNKITRDPSKYRSLQLVTKKVKKAS